VLVTEPEASGAERLAALRPHAYAQMIFER
jgi:hypothetical protein